MKRIVLALLITTTEAMAVASDIDNENDGQHSRLARVTVRYVSKRTGAVIQEKTLRKNIQVDDDAECYPKLNSWWEREGRQIWMMGGKSWTLEFGDDFRCDKR